MGNTTKKDPRATEHGNAGENSLHLDHTLSANERQALSKIFEACFRAIDRQ